MHESLQGATFHVEHIIPQSKGGESSLENIALACPGCNLRKADRTTAADTATGEQVPLFHPIRQRWQEHSDLKPIKWKERPPLAAQRWRCSI
jgi:5-methylcytosine-specific restriction endonuclease McrA